MSGAPDPSEFIEVLAPALRQAAAISRALEGRVTNRPKTAETTEVKRALTIADTASQEALLIPLLEHFPQVRLEAEEDTPTVARFPKQSEALVVIDPIDGTLHSYLAGEGPYSVMVGLAEEDRYVAGMVALPREGLFFDAVRGGGARVTRVAGPPRAAAPRADGDRVLISHGMPPVVSEALRALGLVPIPACGGAISVAPLIPGVRAGLRRAVTPGGVSIRGRIGALIAREAGALLWGTGGTAFPDDLSTPAPILITACEASDLERLARLLETAGLST